MRRLSKLRLLGELRKLLARPDTNVIQKKLKVCGESHWEQDLVEGKRQVAKITILLDSRRDGKVRLVIHELLHIYLAIHFDGWQRQTYEVEEVMVLALEKLLYDYLHAPQRERLLESWAKAIDRKLA
jgi:hypothetical protein